MNSTLQMTSVILLILIGISATIGLFFLNIILGVVCGVVVLVSIAFSQICRYHKNNVIAEETISSLIFIISLFFIFNYFFISLLCITPSIRLSINLLNLSICLPINLQIYQSIIYRHRPAGLYQSCCTLDFSTFSETSMTQKQSWPCYLFN